MIVGSRQEFYQNFSYNADARFFLICNRQVIEVMDNITAQLFELSHSRMLGRDKIFADFFPFFMHGICGTFDFFIRTHTVETTHENIAEDRTVQTTHHKTVADFKSRIFLKTAQIDGDDRDLFHVCLFQCTADKADIIAGTAAAACLGNQNGSLI